MEGLKIVCLGDSITYGWPWGPEISWTTMLARVIDAEVINQGIPGNTTSQMMERFDRAVLAHHPTHVIIMGGINDIVWQESFDRIVWNLRSMAEKAAEHDIKVVFGMPTAVDDDYLEKLTQRIRNWINTHADQHGIPVINFHQAFYNQEGKILNQLLAADGAHPTQEGYQAMFAQIDTSIFT
ncbi:MAG TPA: SGNH/GDSL hydrolase family protein [Syntrophomonas sp.]|nr:SGNH/GDSL hydrolase family protein [Syntrophomonas sp.]